MSSHGRDSEALPSLAGAQATWALSTRHWTHMLDLIRRPPPPIEVATIIILFSNGNQAQRLSHLPRDAQLARAEPGPEGRRASGQHHPWLLRRRGAGEQWLRVGLGGGGLRAHGRENPRMSSLLLLSVLCALRVRSGCFVPSSLGRLPSTSPVAPSLLAVSSGTRLPTACDARRSSSREGTCTSPLHPGSHPGRPWRAGSGPPDQAGAGVFSRRAQHPDGVVSFLGTGPLCFMRPAPPP